MLVTGGPSGIRTHDLLNAIETRSQLRYGPLIEHPQKELGQSPKELGQVDLAGLEPATSSVRLMRAPNCATGPRKGLRIVLRSRNQCQETI